MSTSQITPVSAAKPRRLSGTALYRLCMLGLMTLIAWPQIDNLLSGRGLSSVANAQQPAATTVGAAVPTLPTFASAYPNGAVTIDPKLKGSIPVVYVVNLPDVTNNSRNGPFRVDAR